MEKRKTKAKERLTKKQRGITLIALVITIVTFCEGDILVLFFQYWYFITTVFLFLVFMSNIVKICDKKFKFTLEIFWLSWFNIREFYFKLIVWKVIFESHTIFPKKD